MNILLVTVAYPPVISSASHLMQELAEGLRDRGHNVTIVTTYPRYNLTEEFKDKIFDEFSVENDINIIRVKTLPHKKINFIIRGISELSMSYIFVSMVNKHLKENPEIVIVYCPPLTLSNVGIVIKKKYGAKFILNIQDLFPQNAIDIGVLKNKFLIKLFERIEKRAYKAADSITVHSEGNKEFLVDKKNVPDYKIQVLHNWIDIRTFMNQSRTGVFRKQYGIKDKFILLFAGIIGPSQGLDLIIKVADNLKDIRDICFLLVGDGMEKEKLLKIVNERGLKNVMFQPFVSKDEYPKLVKDVDVGIVCLTCMNKTPVVPGKILGYMAASIPVLAFLNRESDGHMIIRDAKCGYSESSDDVGKATETVRRIYNERDRLKQYGENGFNYASNNFAKDTCIDSLEKIF